MHRREGSRPGRRRRSLAVVVATFALAACSSDGGEAQLPDDFTELPDDEVLALVATPAAVWGNGRALRALPVDDTGLAVVTTTGVHLTDGSGDVVALETFGRSTQVGPSALSDDGSTLAVATLAPSVIRWYDVIERRVIGADKLPVGSEVLDLGFLPGTNDLAAVTSTGVATWPAGPLAGFATPLGEDASVGTSALIADGRIAAPLSDTNEIAVMTPDQVERVALDLPDGATVLQAHSSPDGSTLGVLHGDGGDDLERSDRIVIVDSASFEQIGAIDVGRALRPTDWAVTDAGVAVTDGSTISFWTHAGEELGAGQSPTDQPVTELHASTDDLLSVHRAGAIAGWLIDDGAVGGDLIDPGGAALTDLTVDPERALVSSVDFYGRIATWPPTDPTTMVRNEQFAAGTATSVSVSADDSQIAVAATNGQVKVLGADLTEASTLAVRDSPVHVDAVEFHPTSGGLATGLAERLGELAFDDTVTMWDAAAAPVFSLGGESEDVAGCSFFYNRVRYSSDGSLLAHTSHDFSVSLVDAATGEVLHRFEPLPSTVLDVAFSDDDQYLIATSDVGTVTVWNVADRSVAATYDAAPGGYQAIAVLPGDSVMATADVTGALSLIDILSGETVLTFDGTIARTTSMAVSSNGALLAVPTADATVGIWSTDSGVQLATLNGHAAPVSDMDFARDASWIVTSSADGTVRQWTLDATV